MGDRAQIKFIEETGGELYFYTHWDGYKLHEILQSALERGKDRWDDTPYLARIIFSEMIQHNIKDNTGYGISTQSQDGKCIEVNCKNKTITINKNTYSFEEYIIQGTG